MEKQRGSGVGARLGEIGEALADVYRAEGRSLRSKFEAWLGAAGKTVLLLSLSAVIAFWAIGALVTTAIAALELVLPLWAAAASVAAFLILSAGVLALWMKHRLSELPSPTTLVSQQVGEHLDWWRHGVLEAPLKEDSRAPKRGEERRGEDD